MELDRIPEISKYLSLIFFLAWIGRSTVWNFLPIFIERHIASVFLVGLVTSLPAAIPIIIDIPVGNLVQRAGEKAVIFTGLAAGLFIPVLYFTALPILIVGAKALEGFTKSMVWNGSWSINMKSSDTEVESEALSVFLLGVNLALIVGPVVGGYLIASRGFSITFGLWLFTWALSMIVFLGYIGLEGSRGFFSSVEELFHRNTYSNDWHHLKDNWNSVRFPLALVFLYSVIFSFYWLAIPLLLERMGAGFVMMGMIFGAAALPKAFQFIFGDLADRIGKHKTVALLSLLLTPVLAAMSFVTDIVLLGALFFVARIFSSGMSPPLHALFDEKVPEEIESELTGFMEFFKHAGQTLGPVIAGTVASIWSLNGSFVAAAGISGMLLLLAVYGWKNYL